MVVLRQWHVAEYEAIKEHLKYDVCFSPFQQNWIAQVIWQIMSLSVCCLSVCLFAVFRAKFGKGNQQFECVQFWHLSRSAVQVWQHPSAIEVSLSVYLGGEHPAHSANYRAAVVLQLWPTTNCTVFLTDWLASAAVIQCWVVFQLPFSLYNSPQSPVLHNLIKLIFTNKQTDNLYSEVQSNWPSTANCLRYDHRQSPLLAISPKPLKQTLRLLLIECKTKIEFIFLFKWIFFWLAVWL